MLKFEFFFPIYGLPLEAIQTCLEAAILQTFLSNSSFDYIKSLTSEVIISEAEEVIL